MTTDNKKTIGVVIITHNSVHHLPKCLPPYLNSRLKPRILVVNSSSKDGTVELAKQMGVETLVIPRRTFNHGTTREKARQYLNTDIVVMTTPDAYATTPAVLETLIEPICNNRAAIAYARQISHHSRHFFETFSREFNYPPAGHIRGLKEMPQYGIYTFFCSNSFAAYSNRALDEIGGFEKVLLGEDTVAVAKLLRKGHQIAYVSDAVVKHSHHYTLKQEFQRNFDTGLARKQYAFLLACHQSDSGRGIQYTLAMMRRLIKEKPQLIPYAFLQTAAKWFGYQIGKRSTRTPKWFKRTLSSQDFYWDPL